MRLFEEDIDMQPCHFMQLILNLHFFLGIFFQGQADIDTAIAAIKASDLSDGIG